MKVVDRIKYFTRSSICRTLGWSGYCRAVAPTAAVFLNPTGLEVVQLSYLCFLRPQRVFAGPQRARLVGANANWLEACATREVVDEIALSETLRPMGKPIGA